MSETYLPVTVPQLPVAVDVMGADHGPRVIIEGALQAARELHIPSILVGRESEIRTILKDLRVRDESRLRIQNADQEISMDDSPSAAIRGKPDSSVRVAFQLVKDGHASAMMSAGNTGAVMAAGLFVSGTLPGIGRPAIASLIPKVGNGPPTILLDSGANIDCHAYQLVQFALMGKYYAASIIEHPSPRVALLSNGTETSKGNDITRSAAVILKEMQDVNFVGYVEGDHISGDFADVVVCDGFVGNIVLKAMEGSVELVFDEFRHHIDRSKRGRFGIWLAKPVLKELFRDKFDPSAYGGAPLLGLNHIAIICHGSSGQRAIFNGIRVASSFAGQGVVDEMRQALRSLDLKMPGVYEDGMWNRMGQKLSNSVKKNEKAKLPAESKGVAPKLDSPEEVN